jgi:hypothetical protein
MDPMTGKQGLTAAFFPLPPAQGCSLAAVCVDEQAENAIYWVALNLMLPVLTLNANFLSDFSARKLSVGFKWNFNCLLTSMSRIVVNFFIGLSNKVIELFNF